MPNAARIYDWLLGGKDNYDADRQAGRRLERAVPGIRQAARDNRAYLGRAVHYLASQGITQFIDVGSGLPVSGPVHEVARKVNPAARVAYVDHDPVVVAHARALLADAPGLIAVEADLRQPGALLADPTIDEAIDFAQPVAVLLIAVLHFIEDAQDAHGIVRSVTGALAPGSYLAITHGTADDLDPGTALAAKAAYEGASVPGVPRSRAEVERFFDGLDLIPPGIADVRTWGADRARPSGPVLFWAGLGQVPRPSCRPHCGLRNTFSQLPEAPQGYAGTGVAEQRCTLLSKYWPDRPGTVRAGGARNDRDRAGRPPAIRLGRVPVPSQILASVASVARRLTVPGRSATVFWLPGQAVCPCVPA